MADPFFDNYYDQTKEKLEEAKKAYGLAHKSVCNAIERHFLARFDVEDPRRSRATLEAVSGIRAQLKNFESKLLQVDVTVAVATIQRDQFVSLAGLQRMSAAFQTLSNETGPSLVDLLQRTRHGLADLTRLREDLTSAGGDMDLARRKANLEVGALREAITTILIGRVELVTAFDDNELPLTALQVLKALRDVSAEEATERIGEALFKVVKEVAPEIAEELSQAGKIVRIYKAVVKAFGVHDIDTTPNAVEAVQNLWDAMKAEDRAFSAISALADNVASEIATR